MAAVVTSKAVLVVVEDVMLRPWAWGVADCCAAACDVIARLHGVDPMAPLRGAYASGPNALQVIEDQGGMVGMVRRLAGAAGFVQMPVGQARPGDLGLTRSRPEGRALCVCVGPDAWAAKTLRGYALLDAADFAWTPCPR